VQDLGAGRQGLGIRRGQKAGFEWTEGRIIKGSWKAGFGGQN
jgi:hypothetical protein